MSNRMSYSRINTFQQCPKSYYNKYVVQIEKIEEGEDAVHLSWGKAVHKGLELHYKGKSQDVWEPAVREAYPIDLVPGKPEKSQDSAVEAVKQYVAFYAEQDKMWEILDVEVRETFDVVGIEFAAVLDLVARNRQTGDIYFWDHKTTGRAFSSSYWMAFDLNLQMSAYAYRVKKKYGTCAGGIINGIAVGHRKRAYKGEPAGLWCKFERLAFNRTQAQIEQFKLNVVDWSLKIEQAGKDKSWPMSQGKLCAWCQYRELCISCDDTSIFEVLYRKKDQGSQPFNVEVEV